MKNKNLLIFGILGIVAIPLMMAKPTQPVPPEEGWIWDQAQWDVNKWF